MYRATSVYRSNYLARFKVAIAIAKATWELLYVTVLLRCLRVIIIFFNSTRIQMHPASRFRFFTDLNVICPSFTKWEYEIIYELPDYASSRTKIRDVLIVNNTYVLRELRV